MNELDVNAIAIGVASSALESGAKLFSKTAHDQIDKVRAHFKSGFEAYISAGLSRTGFVKTLVHPDQPVPLPSIYTPLSFRISGKIVSDNYIISKIRNRGRILISGTAGGGKSMLIRHLNVSLLRNYKNLLPIYFELRSLNKEKPSDIVEAIYESVAKHIRYMTRELFDGALRQGGLALVLDGFDEIDHDLRPHYGRQIDDLCVTFPKLGIVVTSRPEENLPGLQDFTVAHVEPMSKRQLLDLIRKIEFDPETRDKFVSEIDDNLFDEHEEFLKNPLLASMMLLTYSYHSEIPAKIHIFYQQAFETLYQRHDRSKGAYKRKSYSDLPIDEFQRVFSHFCASTYIANKYEFDEILIRKYISDSIIYSGCDASSDDFLSDLLESTCLMQRDGVDIAFVHRSFQEYFAARFTCALGDAMANKVIDSICVRAGTDIVVSMIRDMDVDLFERAWVVPVAKNLISRCYDGDNFDEMRLVPDVFDGVSFGVSLVTARNTAGYLGSIAMTLWRIYEIAVREGLRLEISGADVLRAISSVPKLREEFLRIVDGSDLTEGEEDFEERAFELGEEDLRWVKKLNGVSPELIEAMCVRKAVYKEVAGWRRIVKEAEDRLSFQAASLESMLGGG